MYANLTRNTASVCWMQNGFEFYNENGDKMARLLPPLAHTELPSDSSLYLSVQLPTVCKKILIILIQAGEACIARIDDGQLMEYKHIRKYMVRKTQGKAQHKHLKTKGKSREGSRIRLAQTVSFFEEINERINLWISTDNPDRIIYSVPEMMKSLWYNSRVSLPFDRKDQRLKKVNWTVRKPNKDEINRAVKLMNCARLTIFDAQLLAKLKYTIENYD